MHICVSPAAPHHDSQEDHPDHLLDHLPDHHPGHPLDHQDDSCHHLICSRSISQCADCNPIILSMHCNDWFADDCIALKGTYTDIESCRVEWLGQTLDMGAILIGWHTYRLPGLIFLAFLGFINLEFW